MPTIQEQLKRLDAQVKKRATSAVQSTQGRSSRGRPASPSLGGLDLRSVEGLETLARRQEFKPPEESKAFSALRKIGGILNVGAATIAGGVRGALREDVSVLGGAKEGFKQRETFGFGDIIREDLGIKPESRAGKIGVGTAGFIADVIFDPITYLTFGLGSGLKVGGRVLTKTGTAVTQKAAREITQSATENFLKKGFSLEQASKMASKRASPLVNDLVQRSFGKKGITESAARQFVKEGVEEGTITTLKQLGAQIIDKGGIKMFGKTLVKSSTLAKTPIGKAAKLLSETEIAQALKNTLGRTFIADFAKNPKLVSIIDGAKRAQRQTMEGIIKQNEQLFAGLSDNQMSEFFDTVFKKKKEIIIKTGEIEKGTIEQLNKLFPELKVTSPERAKVVLEGLEDKTINEIIKIRDRVDEIVRPFFETRQQLIKEGKTLDTSGLQAGIPLKSLGNVDELNRVIEGLKQQLKDLRKAKGTTPRLGKERVRDLGGEITKDEVKIVANRLIDFEEERLRDVVNKLSDQLLRLKEKPTGLAAKIFTKKLKKLTSGEIIIFSERLIKQLQNELAEKSGLIGKVLDARRIAKAKQRGEKLVFDDQQLQKISDQLFEGDNAIVPRFAKLGGISEEDAIKFYIPSKFKNKIAVKDFAVGRNLSSPDIGFKKKFTGVENENLIRDPFEAFSRGQIQVATARIKDRAFKQAISSLGSATEREGWQHITRKGLDGQKVDGWFPKEIAEELNKFLEPRLKPIDELARATGFDWATGLFKGYLTSLFPGFHVRNMSSNQFQNMLKIGLDVGNINLQKQALQLVRGKNLDKILTTKTGKKVTLGEIKKQIKKESDILSRTGPFGRTEQFLEETKNRIIRKGGLPNINPLSRENIALQKGRKLGSALEAQSKVVSVISAVMQGKTVKEGIKQAEDALFNYSKLTEFERSVMRRLIPFYTFARKNFELQLKALSKTPVKIASQLKFFRGVSDSIGEPVTEEDLESLPSWVLEGVGIKAGVDEYGRGLFFSGFGLPIEEFLKWFSGDKNIIWNTAQNLISQSNPILKFPAERATGVDFFRDRPLTDITNGQQLKVFIDAMPGPIAKEFKELVEWKELPNQPIYAEGKVVGMQTKYRANPFALHLIRNLPTSRITGTVGFISSEQETNYNKVLRFFTGVKGWTIDQEEQKFFKDLDRKKELTDWLLRMGVVKRFETIYEPSTPTRSTR